MFSKKLVTMRNVDEMDHSTVTATSFMIDRHERSPLEFEGALLFETDGSELTGDQTELPRYRIRVYQELCRDFVLEVAVVADNKVIFQTADFAQSVNEVDELLCLVHGDVMDGLSDSVQAEAAELQLLDKRLEASLDRLSNHVVERLTTFEKC